ncbi:MULTISPECIES: thioredoxin fold domain-containing protein [Cronobacter]|uniref:thioredoxin fold domain-containing protein n=1 Tax=Cronobacter TaxID=413496 RepID=UPI000D005F54|nr:MULTISPECIES: thioredoxin fold domain-containing protein [Cronobacter]EKM0439595.1 thioredoxin fold domain-containing protein [Cronobacter turicensis]WRU16730.1 thioredoxin fold domain-containing protein [Cronobacter malonaticus]
MKISHKNGPFVVEINGGILSARQFQAAEGWDTGSELAAEYPLFMFPLRQMPWFVIHSDGLYAQNAHDSLTPLYRGQDAKRLLTCLERAICTHEWRKSFLRKLAIAFISAALFITGYLALNVTEMTTPQVSRGTVTGTQNHAYATLPAQSHSQKADAAFQGMTTESLPMPEDASQTTQNTMTSTPADGWSLSQEVRAGLPEKLRKAASRGIFTVNLSSGHARTLYVFADPECANCRRMERHFETVSGMVNVVIFPVTIEGRESSLKSLTPVMQLPETERAAAWKQLFDADAGITVPGKAEETKDETLAETARGAIGVNEVAFRAYRLPGTPWTISDDGRYVPQAVLSSPAALTAFLNGDDHDGQ